LGELRQDLIDSVEDALSLGGNGEGLPDNDDIALFNDLVSDPREEFAEMAERLTERDTRSADTVRDLAGHDNPDGESLQDVYDTLDHLLDSIINDPSIPDEREIEVVLPDGDEFDLDDLEEFFKERER